MIPIKDSLNSLGSSEIDFKIVEQDRTITTKVKVSSKTLKSHHSSSHRTPRSERTPIPDVSRVEVSKILEPRPPTITEENSVLISSVESSQ